MHTTTTSLLSILLCSLSLLALDTDERQWTWRRDRWYPRGYWVPGRRRSTFYYPRRYYYPRRFTNRRYGYLGEEAADPSVETKKKPKKDIDEAEMKRPSPPCGCTSSKMACNATSTTAAYGYYGQAVTYDHGGVGVYAAQPTAAPPAVKVEHQQEQVYPIYGAAPVYSAAPSMPVQKQQPAPVKQIYGATPPQAPVQKREPVYGAPQAPVQKQEQVYGAPPPVQKQEQVYGAMPSMPVQKQEPVYGATPSMPIQKQEQVYGARPAPVQKQEQVPVPAPKQEQTRPEAKQEPVYGAMPTSPPPAKQEQSKPEVKQEARPEIRQVYGARPQSPVIKEVYGATATQEQVYRPTAQIFRSLAEQPQKQPTMIYGATMPMYTAMPTAVTCMTNSTMTDEMTSTASEEASSTTDDPATGTKPIRRQTGSAESSALHGLLLAPLLIAALLA